MIPVMMLAITADESYPALNKILDDKLVKDVYKRQAPLLPVSSEQPPNGLLSRRGIR